MALSVDVLKLKDFRFLLSARMFGIMALQAQAVIVGWQVYTLTKDPLMLGLAGLVEAVPAIICALFSGHIVDKNKPHRILSIAIAVLVINTFMLYLFGGGIINAGNDSNLVAIIFVGIFISGLARSFIAPCTFSLLSQIVSRGKLTSATAWFTSVFQFSAITGPAVAGIIYGGYGPHGAWLMPTILMSLALIMLLGISAKHSNFQSPKRDETAMQSIVAGWKFIIHNRIMLSVMALDMFAVLFGGVVAILPVFADQVLHIGSQGLGVLRASPAIGSIAMALILALYPMKHISMKVLLYSVAAFGICMIGFGLSTTFYSALIFLVLSGVFDSVSMIMRGTIMQLYTPTEMKGRVSSVNSMFIISSNEIGAFRAGVTAKFFDLVPSIIAGGIGTLLVVAATTAITPKLRKLKVKAEDII